MKITIGSETFELEFEHHLKGAFSQQQACRAALKAEDGRVYWTAAEAYSLCQPGDQYNKFVGRKLALGRLLKPYPRPVRAQVWKQYWRQTNREEFLTNGQRSSL